MAPKVILFRKIFSGIHLFCQRAARPTVTNRHPWSEIEGSVTLGATDWFRSLTSVGPQTVESQGKCKEKVLASGPVMPLGLPRTQNLKESSLFRANPLQQ